MTNVFIARAAAVTALVDTSGYQYFQYTGKPITLRSNGGSVFELQTGSKFGVRRSGDGKKIRLIEPDEPTKVFTLNPEWAEHLGKNCKPTKV